MGIFKMSDAQVAEWRQQCRDLAADDVNGEEPWRRQASARTFKLGIRGRNHKLGDEVGVWEQPGLTASADRSGTMTALTLESPAGGNTTLVGISIKDGPVSQEPIAALTN